MDAKAVGQRIKAAREKKNLRIWLPSLISAPPISA